MRATPHAVGPLAFGGLAAALHLLAACGVVTTAYQVTPGLLDAYAPPECADGMCRVPAGPFWQGCNASVDRQCQRAEFPGREVTLRAFDIDETEVTQAAYQRCLDAGACPPPGDEASGYCNFLAEETWDPAANATLPVCVPWEGADAYCRWAGKRLPTEAEWEKAARGTDGRVFPWGNSAPTCERAVYLDCGHAPVPVGLMAGTGPHGAKDMAGGAAEWVADWFDDRYYASAPDSDPRGPQVGEEHALRGGGWSSEARDLRTSARDLPPEGVGGFRCARPVP